MVFSHEPLGRGLPEDRSRKRGKRGDNEGKEGNKKVCHQVGRRSFALAFGIPPAVIVSASI